MLLKVFLIVVPDCSGLSIAVFLPAASDLFLQLLISSRTLAVQSGFFCGPETATLRQDLAEGALQNSNFFLDCNTQ